MDENAVTSAYQKLRALTRPNFQIGYLLFFFTLCDVTNSVRYITPRSNSKC